MYDDVSYYDMLSFYFYVIFMSLNRQYRFFITLVVDDEE